MDIRELTYIRRRETAEGLSAHLKRLSLQAGKQPGSGPVFPGKKAAGSHSRREYLPKRGQEDHLCPRPDLPVDSSPDP